MKLNYKPLFNNIVVEEVVPTKKTKSGVIKPESAKDDLEDLNKMRVVAVGDEVKYVKVGDVVSINVFGFQTATPVKIEDSMYRIFTENLVIGIYTTPVVNILNTASVVN
jgi:co-chaperonin GroES (HSP10)